MERTSGMSQLVVDVSILGVKYYYSDQITSLIPNHAEKREVFSEPVMGLIGKREDVCSDQTSS